MIRTAALALAAVLAAGAPARAETIGYRIEVRACRGETCRTLPGSARRWDGRYACQNRAGTIARFADLLAGRTGRETIQVRCIDIEGMPNA